MTDKQLTDREILEACARACGYEHPSGSALDWNPFTDDGDCFRMETKAGITIDTANGYSANTAGTIMEDFTPGSDAERRRASCLVVARAQLAKEMAK
jgi:hypothetical protein